MTVSPCSHYCHFQKLDTSDQYITMISSEISLFTMTRKANMVTKHLNLSEDSFFFCFCPTWLVRILVPWAGINLGPLQWKCRVLITKPPGIPFCSQFKHHFPVKLPSRDSCSAHLSLIPDLPVHKKCYLHIHMGTNLCCLDITFL